MKFTINWLKQYLDSNASNEEIITTLTNIGLEVEEVTDKAKDLAPFITAKIIDAKPHPDADKLQVCTVDNGSEKLQIVCGAPNARTGIAVVLAPIGAYIPKHDFKIKQSKIRGVQSNGMLCSADELGLGTDADGIIELPEDTAPGQPYAKTFGLDDCIIEIAITPNRQDCLSVYGIARDLAAAGLGDLKDLEIPTPPNNGENEIKINLNTQNAPYYVGVQINGVDNIQSPAWLQQRLESIGIPPKSALVDITNYLTFDLGRPAHVYDLDKLSKDITIFEAKGGEEFTSLDDKQYKLEKGNLAISSNNNIIAIGGVIGGKDSAVTAQTKNIFLEIAYFEPTAVAQTGRVLQIDSDARYRFERGIDPAFLQDGAAIATKLITDICGGSAYTPVIAGTEPKWQKTINFKPQLVKNLGGIDIEQSEIELILSDLGFALQQDIDDLNVFVPSWRCDIDGAPDLVEEILRIYGFDAIPVTPLPVSSNTPALQGKELTTHKAKRILANSGLNEVVTYTFMQGTKAALFTNNNILQVKNPISTDLSHLRPSILPNLLDAAKSNANRGIKNLSIFEVGVQFDNSTELVVATGIRNGNTSDKNHYNTTQAFDIYHAKADIFGLITQLGFDANKAQIKTYAPSYYHPGRSAGLYLGKNCLGYFGELHPNILKEFGIKNRIVGFECFIHNLPQSKGSKATYNPSEYQSVSRDFAFVLDKQIKIGDVLNQINKADKLITNTSIFDVYEGDKIDTDKKSVAINVTITPQDKTLNDNEIEAISQNIIHLVSDKFNGSLRA